MTTIYELEKELPMNKPDLFEAQAAQDTRDRVADLELALQCARNRREHNPLAPAHRYGGAFTGMLEGMRYCDVPAYIEYLKEREGI